MGRFSEDLIEAVIRMCAVAGPLILNADQFGGFDPAKTGILRAAGAITSAPAEAKAALLEMQQRLVFP